MKDLRKVFTLLFVLGAVIAFVAPASAQPISGTIAVAVDEFGYIILQLSYDGVAQTLGPALAGELGPPLTYIIGNPANFVEGDVLIHEQGSAADSNISDVIRFTLADVLEVLVFYSDNEDGSEAPADIGLPTDLLTNQVSVTEIGSEGNNYALYTPSSNQPGYFTAPIGIGDVIFTPTYKFVSDGTLNVPEPSTILLLGAGLAGIGLLRRRFKK